MQLSKFLKIIWSINGVLILIVFLFSSFMVIKEFVRNINYYREPELIVGEELEEAKEKGLILQGLEYSDPSPIYGTENYIVPIEVRTYDNPKEDYDHEVLKESFNYGESYSRGINLSDMVDVVFLDKELNVLSRLLNKKAFIKNLQYPSKDNFNQYNEEASNFNFILYEIAFEDSNNDGALTEDDNTNLYFSDLNGKNLTKITNDVDILSFKITNPENILIRYLNRTSEAQEHKRDHLSLYSVKTKDLKELSSLNSTLDEIEKNLFK